MTKLPSLTRRLFVGAAAVAVAATTLSFGTAGPPT